jgi:hypothetical protein
MAENIQVEAARIPDRERLLATLKEHGLDARPHDDAGIEVRCDAAADSDTACDDVLVEVEHLVMELGAPFVPVKHDGVIYIRPPIS